MASSHKIETLAFPVLLGDIGGTNARFALLPGRDEEVLHFAPVRTGDFPSIESAVGAAVFDKTDIRPRSALFALAGPIDGDEVDLTNAEWVIRPRDVMAATGISDIALLNDFEAQALAISALDDPCMTTEAIGPELATEANCRVVLGPGTGLGVAGLVYASGLWTPVPGEGGHVALGPDADDEFPIWPHIEKEGGRISAEALLAGRGIPRLYRAVAAARGLAAELSTPAEVTNAALGGQDPLALATMTLYCRLLGRVAGDLALVFMATGGVFIAGGIAPRIALLLKEGEFRRAFEAKYPHENLMRQIATRLITASQPALTGLAAFARAPENFSVPLDRRRWR
ncbi:glucokinase [Rhodopseudomonas julia]|uniref:Glucokinase n=1 Tax=Rhodopseudomonas julia TaxID=200617 RepID=A0ABU0C3G7_9BRAD|nr:glucokinase [Rhodopseudomonas julia]MDQ0325049.1 glucokinase [Rhodopseudomonas julia]